MLKKERFINESTLGKSCLAFTFGPCSIKEVGRAVIVTKRSVFALKHHIIWCFLLPINIDSNLNRKFMDELNSGMKAMKVHRVKEALSKFPIVLTASY